jgi:hypothetical protein
MIILLKIDMLFLPFLSSRDILKIKPAAPIHQSRAWDKTFTPAKERLFATDLKSSLQDKQPIPPVLSCACQGQPPA